MKSLTICIIFFIVFLQSGAVWTQPAILPISPEDLEKQDDRFVYKEKNEINLKCENGTKWGAVTLEEGNPVFPEATFETEEFNTKPDIKLKITYFNEFVKIVKVRCWDDVLGNDTKIIEQNYSTTTARILTADQHVYASQEVQLDCIADGNPAPEYRWVNDESKEISKNATIKITTPDAKSAAVKYQCQARNNEGNPWKESQWVSVTSTFVGAPLIAVTPAAINASYALFEQVPKVELKCTLQKAEKDIELSMEYDVIHENSIFPPVFPVFNLKKNEVNVELGIEYTPNYFVRYVNVSCNAYNRKTYEIKNSSSILIEQKYPVQNVVIPGPSHIQVGPGTTVQLHCVSDGNPLPSSGSSQCTTIGSYQWHYKNSSKDFEQIDDENNDSLTITGKEEWLPETQYKCEVNNTIKKDKPMVSNAVTVTFTFVDSPIIELVYPQKPVNSSSTKWTFDATTRVALKCSLPHPLQTAVGLTMAVKTVQTNPLFPDEQVRSYVSTESELQKIEIYYNADRFIPLLTVTCNVVNLTNGEVKKPSEIQIEQKYPTRNVAIDGSRRVEIDAGESFTLNCRADGNPEPKYLWYSEEGDNRLLQETKATFNPKLPEDKSSVESYSCDAWNEENGENATSEVVTVISTFVPDPKIEPITPAKETAGSYFTYVNTSSILVSCSLPPPIVKGVELKMETEITEMNPVFPDANVVTIIEKKDARYYEIKLQYDHFIPKVNVSCHVSAANKVKKTSSLTIEQHYKPTRAILTSADKQQVDAGTTVTVSCLADGNPSPNYQWYNKRTGLPLINETKNSSEVATPVQKLTNEAFYCVAGNISDGGVRSPAASVIGIYYKPQIEAITKPTSASSEKLTYEAETKVQLTCKLPGLSLTKYKLVAYYDQMEDNPTFLTQGITFTSKEETDAIQLDIEYNPDKLVPAIKVTCQSVLEVSPSNKNETEIRIEQLFKTMNVAIKGRTNMQPQEETKLMCIADGNPRPESFQWYEVTNDKKSEIAGANTASYVFRATQENKYKLECGAKNKYNEDFVSGSTEVTVKIDSTTSDNSAIRHQTTWLFLILTILAVYRTL